MQWIASLPWYDLPEIQESTDQFWSGLTSYLQEEGVSQLPQKLNRTIPYEKQWSSSNFLFGQACGYDVVLSYKHCLRLLGTPRYEAKGCSSSNYKSFIVVHKDSPIQSLPELFGKHCVINNPTSHSGMNSLRLLIAPFARENHFFEQVSVSGSHENSLLSIQKGAADVAAIDCVSYALFQKYRQDLLASIKIIAQTPSLPSPPYVTGKQTPEDLVDKLQSALAKTMQDSQLKKIRQNLLLEGIDFLTLDCYEPMIPFPTGAKNLKEFHDLGKGAVANEDLNSQ